MTGTPVSGTDGAVLPAFLHALWGDAVSPTRLLQTWTLGTRRLEQWHSRTAARDIAGRHDTYMGVALSGRIIDHRRRPTAADAIAIPGMWADIDIAGTTDGRGGVKAQGARDLDHARRIAGLILEPTIIVHSGHGLQAWWLFDDGPWVFRTADEQRAGALLALRWGAELGVRALLTGARLDSVHDLARLMRAPGTINAKDPAHPVPVTVVSADGPRHPLASFQRATAGRTETLRAGSLSAGGAGSGAPIPMVPVTDELSARLAAIAEASPAVAAILDGSARRLFGWSPSQADLSLAGRLAAITNPITGDPMFSDPEIKALTRRARLQAQPGDPKADRARYWELTLDAARRGRAA